MSVPDRPMLDRLGEFKMGGRVDRTDQLMRFLHHVADVMQPWPGPFLQNEIVRIILAMQQCTDDPFADTAVVGNAKADVAVEGRSGGDIRHQHLKVVQTLRAGAPLLVRARI